MKGRNHIKKHWKRYLIGVGAVLIILMLSHWLGPKMNEPIVPPPAVEEPSE